MAARRAIPCSAAATVLAVGALTTRQPCSVAAARSTLSIPTPALPTTLSLPPDDSKTSRETLVPLRTISASQSEILVQSSSVLRLYEQSTLAKSLSSFSPASPSFSATSTVGLASSPADTSTTSGREAPRRGRSETEKAEERGSLEERESEGDGKRRLGDVAVAMKLGRNCSERKKESGKY
ncbi:hypothetical protein V8G54_028790 [Vigna mungo]|uniref:Uncharacterized protein n=1 Tax=Vigna mungo TaxID=3915 RepID=A0AAQ3MS38_VIGMU